MIAKIRHGWIAIKKLKCYYIIAKQTKFCFCHSVVFCLLDSSDPTIKTAVSDWSILPTTDFCNSKSGMDECIKGATKKCFSDGDIKAKILFKLHCIRAHSPKDQSYLLN